ncbi:MAG: glycoside hydrolase family 18 protein [Clostridia bacterium]|nr:glycoside hydrolase family 18 protein [Clostridia bacterium]
MQIHVVRPGDSLWSISRRYGVSVQRIVQVNELQDIPHLVEGQALVIPSEERTYTVKAGESIWSIAQRFGVSVYSIAKANNLTSPYLLYPGMTLRIPGEAKNYGFIEVNGYIKPESPEEAEDIITDVGTYLTYVSPFSYRVRADGSLIPMSDEAVLRAARPFRAAPLLVITNETGETFDTELVHTILSSEAVQNTLINNILNTLRSKGYYGLNIDFERVRPADRQLYNNFLRKVTDALRPQGYLVSTALAPKVSGAQTGAWYEAHDYPAHGEIVDFVVPMTYEWGWSGGPPMPVAPIDQVRRVINYAVSVMPPKKIMMGIPLYGYNWTLPYTPHGAFAPTVSPQEAIRLAARYGARIQYDKEAESPFFNYIDENRAQHIVWFEDARSIQAKFRLASEYGLRGVSYWVLGVPFPQNWAVLNDMFEIVKVVR